MDPPSEAVPVEAGWRQVALPSEHGGWSLTLEPVLLGLLAVPSPAGLALGIAALLAFLSRVPVKVLLVDRLRQRRLPRTRRASRVAILYLAGLVASVAVAAVTAESSFWVPLALAGPLVGVELWYDARSRSRRLVPELAGTVGIAAVAAAIGLAGGAPAAVAAGLWVVPAARAIATVPFVRVQILRGKGRPHRRASSDSAQAIAVAGTGAATMAGWVPPAGLVAILALGLVQVALVRARPPRVAILGAQQVVLGLAVVVTAGLGFRMP